MDFVSVCIWCFGIKSNDPLFPITDDVYPNQKRCCDDDCRHRYDEGGCNAATTG